MPLKRSAQKLSQWLRGVVFELFGDDPSAGEPQPR